MSAEEVAKAFVQHYYQTFDGNVDQLAGLYVSVHDACSFGSRIGSEYLPYIFLLNLYEGTIRLCTILCKARRPQSSTSCSTSLVFVFMNPMLECFPHLRLVLFACR
jgi:hypothetical protein